MANFAVVGIRIHFCATMRARGFVDGLSTLETKHCFWVVNGSAKRADLTGCLLLQLLLLHGLVVTLKRRFPLHHLRTDSTLRLFVVRIIVVVHIAAVIISAKLTKLF